MPTTTLRTLSQQRPAAGTLVTAYAAPSGGSALVSTLLACNTGDLATTIRIRLAPAGAADVDTHALFQDVPLGAGDTMTATLGLTLGATDALRLQSASGTVSFTISGQETTP